MIPLNHNMSKEEKVSALKLRRLEELLKQYGVDLAYFKGEVGEKGDSIEGEKGENGQSIKGDDGYTPIKGVDYFDGKDGKTPVKGVDYFDGKDGKTPVKGVDYFDGKDGKTPVKGVDYFTQDDIRLILAQIKVPPVDEQAIIDKLSTSIDSREGDNQVVTVKSLINFLQKGGFRGGAGSGVSTATQISKILTYNGDGTLNKVSDSLGTKTMGYTSGLLTSLVGTGVYKSKSYVYNGEGQLININV